MENAHLIPGHGQPRRPSGGLQLLPHGAQDPGAHRYIRLDKLIAQRRRARNSIWLANTSGSIAFDGSIQLDRLGGGTL